MLATAPTPTRPASRAGRHDLFTTVRAEGAILPVDLLQRVVNRDPDLGGLDPADYHLVPGERLNEAINRAWNRLLAAWEAFAAARRQLPPTNPATGATRERWLLPLFQELGYGRLQAAGSIEAGGATYPISHRWGHAPIHLVGAGVDLDRRTPGVAGAARMSPHGLLQEALNRSDAHLWGVVSNGLRLRLLRDNLSLTRQAYVEFDLEAMMAGEVYADFVLLWLLCHQSRVEGERPETCWLERWSQRARQDGTRALDALRQGVEGAIVALGAGFLRQPGNDALRQSLRQGRLDQQEYYRQLLRLVYRLLFLFVAEDRDLLLTPEASPAARERYTRYYATQRLRRLAQRWRGTRHVDLWRGLALVFDRLGSDEGCATLGLPALGSFLWSAAATPDLDGCDIANADLLDALRSLAYIDDRAGRRPVDYRNLGSEELGSVYESLLELHPVLNLEAHRFTLRTAGGNERKTTGSYYTPTSLITSLLDSALDPVLDAATQQADPESAILALKVCDPACGSGHFLIAAAHRMAKRLAAVRSGDDEPAPAATRAALRDVVAHCLYGVDINPMAVELCKVALWMEALEPGKPLSFLEHRIRAGNSLLGATPALIAGGIPEEAFNPIEGDDKAVARDWKKRNREQRAGQLSFGERELPAWERRGDLALALRGLEEEDDDTIEGIRRKQAWWADLIRGAAYESGMLLADAWCAAFVWPKTKAFAYPITQSTFDGIRRNPHSIPVWMRDEIRRLAAQYRFFHWHLAFPDVFRAPDPGRAPENAQAGWDGGFDVVLGNPPWDQIQLDAREFFAERRPDIAGAQHMSARNKMIERLAEDDPALYHLYAEEKRVNEGVQHFVHSANRYPLTSFGRLNTAPLFAELFRATLCPTGRAGLIVPTGIATDSFTQQFFRDLIETDTLVSLYDFENREKIFPAVDSRVKFCLLTLAGADRVAGAGAEFAFFLHDVADLGDDARRFALSAADLALLNPNTRTCPIFRTRRDAEITKAIYRRVPVLVNEGAGDKGNPWGFRGLLMFMMNTASGLFRTREQLEADGWQLQGNVFARGGERYLPLYEAKMVDVFDHRAADVVLSPTAMVRQGQPSDLTPAEKVDPARLAIPRSWVPQPEVDRRLTTKWDRGWLLGWRDITSATNERTVIASVLPRVGVGDKFLLMLPTDGGPGVALLLANLNSFVLDYSARQKVGGTSLKYFTMRQLPFLTPDRYSTICEWDQDERISTWLRPRVLELTYTAWDMQPFAKDLGYNGPPFRWDEERRFWLRCELDAAFFHLYGIDRDDVDYIMDTFPIVQRKDIAAHGHYRTKDVILAIYDAMAAAMASGAPYQTRLEPPPGDPSAAHGAGTIESTAGGA